MKFKIINKPSEAVLKIAESVRKIGIEKGFDYTDNDADFVIAIGGDGTLLRAIREGKPIVGVKAGRRGFLMDVPKERIEEVFDRIRSGDFKEEKYILLEGEFNGKKVKAFNEIGVMFDRPEPYKFKPSSEEMRYQLKEMGYWFPLHKEAADGACR